jgi:hypothetical protein
MVHVSAGPPAIPDGGLSPGRFCPWPPAGRLPEEGNASGLTHRHPVALGFAAEGAAWCAGPPVSGDAASGHVPRAPGPEPGVPSLGVGSGDHGRRGGPAGIAPTGSCARPPPAWCRGRTLNPRSVPVAVSPGWAQDLLDGLSASLSRRAWPPTPTARGGPRPVSASTTAAFPSCGPGRRCTKPVQRLHYGALVEAAGLAACAGPQGCSPPRALLPLRPPPSGSRDFAIRASRGLLPPHAPDMLAVRIGPWTAEDLHLIRYAALSAAPRTPAFSCCRKPERSAAQRRLEAVSCKAL